MAKEVKTSGKTLYICEQCGMAYRERGWAEKCEAWDEAHPGTCNLEIIEHAVLPDQSATG